MQTKDSQTVYLKDYQPPKFLIDETFLQVDLFEKSALIKCTLNMRRNLESLDAKSADLVLDGDYQLNTLSVKVDEITLSTDKYRIEGNKLIVSDLPSSFSLSTEVEISPYENTRLEGFYRSGEIFCTQCEAEGFRNITWYLDRPDVMSVFTTTISAEKKYPTLLSNGNKISSGESEHRHWATWSDPFPKPSYLFAMVVGDLASIEESYVTGSGREVALKIFSEKHNIDKVNFAMSSLKNAMRWDEKNYGREYDLDIFMIVAVESFNMGAMENKGLNIFNTSCVLASPETTTDAAFQRVESVVGHEYFHNWSGNRITCRDWFQLSLKEGFTVFRDQQFSASMGSPSVCRINDVSVLRNVQFPEDAGPTSHPVRPSSYIEINNFYTPTVYEKGAELVRMISSLLGAQRFRQGTDLYFDRHDGEAVTTEEFLCSMEDATGVELTQFRNWYSVAGTPVIEVSGKYDSNKKIYTLKTKQLGNLACQDEEIRAFQIPFKIGLLDSVGKDMRFSAKDSDTADIDDTNGYSVVLDLNKQEQEFVLSNVTEKPLPSLLRGFSAPVKLNYAYSRDELTFLMSYDSDSFNRWEAANRLATQILLEISGFVENETEIFIDERLIEAVGANLRLALDEQKDASYDKAMLANMLTLPTEAYLIDASSVANVDAISQARKILKRELALRFEDHFYDIFWQNDLSGPYSPDGESIASRQLKNLALQYLVSTEKTEAIDICIRQLKIARNMTEESAALRELVFSGSARAKESKESSLLAFYQKWKSEPLVVDLWLGIQASCPLEGTLSKVKDLMQHESFDLKIPNRVRALISQFASSNFVNFHNISGDGYKFLGDRVAELNEINPQIASRLMVPLTRWRKYDETRQDMMKRELARILEIKSLSSDVYEIASKSL